VTLAEAESWLLGRELFGMRFGLDRMRRLLTVLGSPQDRFAAVHVVGTNGKSSTTRFTAALLAQEGRRTGAYLSPHLVSFRERIRIGDADLEPDAFAAAIERVAGAARKVDRTLGDGDRVTQFEALTAAAYAEFAARGVDVAVVEAGLGGRWDATNVIAAPVVALTGVDLEHTRWLGPTIRDIAREKLAVVGPGATLVVPAGLAPDAMEEARAAPAGRLVVVPAPGADADAGGLVAFQRRNLALAVAAAEALTGRPVGAVPAGLAVPGRFQVVDTAPLTVLDGAHNPSGMRALVGSLDGRRVTAVVSILDDKDAGEMLRALLPACERVVCTSSANPRALPPSTLASLTEQLGGVGGGEIEVEPDPHRALARARELAGPDGTVLATGSIYLVADLVRPTGDRSARSRL
jgi:dihydrofolate synthase/folylpolyglutamate synthase